MNRRKRLLNYRARLAVAMLRASRRMQVRFPRYREDSLHWQKRLTVLMTQYRREKWV